MRRSPIRSLVPALLALSMLHRRARRWPRPAGRHAALPLARRARRGARLHPEQLRRRDEGAGAGAGRGGGDAPAARPALHPPPPGRLPGHAGRDHRRVRRRRAGGEPGRPTGSWSWPRSPTPRPSGRASSPATASWPSTATPTKEMPIGEATRRMKGAAGSQVVLSIERAGLQEPRVVHPGPRPRPDDQRRLAPARPRGGHRLRPDPQLPGPDRPGAPPGARRSAQGDRGADPGAGARPPQQPRRPAGAGGEGGRPLPVEAA